jgi:hypothetical protein
MAASLTSDGSAQKNGKGLFGNEYKPVLYWDKTHFKEKQMYDGI